MVVVFHSVLGDAALSDFRVHHYTHAGCVVGERDVPCPAVLVGLDENVGGVGIGQTARSLEVGIDRHVAEVVVPLSQIHRPAQGRGLSAGVNNPVGVDGGGGAVRRPICNACYAVAVEYGAGDGALFAYPDTAGAGVV